MNLRISAVLVAALVIGGGLFWGLRPSAHPNDGSTGPPGVLLPTPIQHVVVLFFENANVSDVLKNGPFERYLLHQYAFASQYYGVDRSHNSTAEYLYATSGHNSRNGTALPQLLDAAGESWAGFAESMPYPCDNTPYNNITRPLYDRDHNPFVNYNSVLRNQTYCQSHDLNFTAWDADVRSGTLPYYSFVSPNNLNDAHDTNVSYADSWLRGWLTPLVNSTLFARTAFLITYDDAPGDDSGVPGTVGGGHIYAVVVSPFAHRFFNSTVPYNHFNLLTTTEWLLGLGHTKYHDDWTLYPPMVDLFDFASTYNVTGTVTASGVPVAGATVSGDGYNVTAGPTGVFTLPLPNGLYQLVAATPRGCASSPVTVVVNGAPVTQNFALACPP